MSWKNFFIIAGVLLMGNIFVYAQDLPTSAPTSIPTGIPSVPATIDPSRYNAVPEGALNAINNISPQQINQLPESVRQDLARRQQDVQDRLRLETLRGTGSPVVDGNLPVSSASPSATSGPSSSSGATFDPIDVAGRYVNEDNSIRDSNALDTLDMATKFEVQLWRQYYNTIADDIHDLHSVYDDVSDSLSDYSDQLDTMLNRLPHTVSNCQRQ